MLSGIGRSTDLVPLHIEQVVDSPEVGHNLYDRKFCLQILYNHYL